MCPADVCRAAARMGGTGGMDGMGDMCARWPDSVRVTSTANRHATDVHVETG